MGRTLSAPPRAVLFDRDGTLVIDVPYNGDADKVRPMPGAAEVLHALRQAGIPLGVLTNQSGIARGLLTRDEVDQVNRRVEQLLGPFDLWCVCPHGTDDGCSCRKPQPGLIHQACVVLGLQPAEVVFIGDIGSDVEAAAAAGAASVLVPTAATRPEEIDAAPVVAANLRAAVDVVFPAATVGAG